MQDLDDDRPTQVHERPDSTRPTVAMPPLFDEPADDSGVFIAGYSLDGELGRGTSGVVYAATHPVISKRVAIKVLPAKLDRGAIERFLCEVRDVNALGHANIVEIFDFGTLPDGRQYLVMDLLPGEVLTRRMRRAPMTFGEAVSVMDEISAALAAAHEHDLIHRDLSPGNVYLVVKEGRPTEVRLLGFGLGDLLPSRDGAAPYVAPEQARALDTIDHRVDIYALGVISYQLLTGMLPFVRTTAIDTLIAHVSAPIPKLPDTLDPELAELVEAMLSKSPEDRPSLVEIRYVLRHAPSTPIDAQLDPRIPQSLHAAVEPEAPTLHDGPRARAASPRVARGSIPAPTSWSSLPSASWSSTPLPCARPAPTPSPIPTPAPNPVPRSTSVTAPTATAGPQALTIVEPSPRMVFRRSAAMPALRGQDVLVLDEPASAAEVSDPSLSITRLPHAPVSRMYELVKVMLWVVIVAAVTAGVVVLLDLASA